MIEEEYADICHVLTRLKNLPRRNMLLLPRHKQFHSSGPRADAEYNKINRVASLLRPQSVVFLKHLKALIDPNYLIHHKHPVSPSHKTRSSSVTRKIVCVLCLVKQSVLISKIVQNNYIESGVADKVASYRMFNTLVSPVQTTK